MDLGLSGRTAIVCAASKGLGKASALSLAREGVSVFITARTEGPLNDTAKDIALESGATVTPVVGDITTPEGRKAVLAACPDPDVLVNNAGGPPTGNFRDFEPEDWLAAVNANMISAIEMIKATVDGMIERKFGRIVNITSAAVRQPIPDLCLSNAARAGLTGFVAGLSRETVRHNVTINNILPGAHETDRLFSNLNDAAKREGKDPLEVIAKAAAANPAGRFGLASDFGDACAFLCSAQAGYITGHNLLLDGGSFKGTM
ncbi:MAG: SDR family oxidoreductase [Alphaproteobacteria bacterium]